MTLFGRAWRVTIGTLRVSAPIRVSFEIEKTDRPTPNKATVDIWNLTRDHQAQIEGAASAQVIIEAGYDQDRGVEQLFAGDLFRARGAGSAQAIGSHQDGTDVITHIEARDGGTRYREALVEASFDADVLVSTVVRHCADAMRLGVGNAVEAVDRADLLAGGRTFPEGTVLSGNCARELTRVLTAMGLRWSVQAGALQVLRVGERLRARAVRLSPSTGLIGAPEIGTRGRVTARALLTPELAPGRAVQLESARVSGLYVVREVAYKGDSEGNDTWTSTCLLAPEQEAA